jgi:CRP/FNR family cyclic AMP-dependent transcriptional regulator
LRPCTSAGLLRLLGKCSWLSEVGEEAALAQPCDGREAVVGEREDHQSVGARYRRLRIGEVAAEGGLVVGAGGHEPEASGVSPSRAARTRRSALRTACASPAPRCSAVCRAGVSRLGLHSMRATDEEATNFLDLLGTEERSKLEARGRWQHFESGQILMYEGQVGDRVMVLLAGVAKVTHVTESGREMVLRLCGPGELVGELALVDGKPRSSTVVALESGDALTIPGSTFLTVLNELHGVPTAVLRMLARRFRDADRKRIEFAASDAIGRVAARLCELCERYGDPSDVGIAIKLHLSQEELAGWSACSRDAVVKALHQLRELNWIETGRRRITVLDLDALRNRAA